jgi:hypothetical protein
VSLSPRLALPLLLLVFVPRPVLSWGPTGHRAVGRIAERHLSEAAARGVAAILGSESLVQASTWPDEIKSDPDWRSTWNVTAPWHYVTIDDGATYDTAPKEPRGDVIEAIGRFLKTLQDPRAEREKKVVALRYLVHLVGDIHQPLHVGRNGDVGGNSIKVTWFDAETNLHSVWDEKIIEAEKLSFSELAELIDHPTDTEVRTWQSGGVLDWAGESMAVRDRVYAIGDGKLGYSYAYQNGPLVKRRILQAGIRLAGLLNTLFDSPGPSIPDRPPLGAPPS